MLRYIMRFSVRFDSFKRRNAENQVPICLHPTALMQILQFWLPRTPQFEEAVLGSLRWPLLLQEFDPAAEKVTIQILTALARFENVSELPQEVITNILVNQALRQKLAVEGDIKKQVELVREALVEENEEVRSMLANTTEEAKLLKREIAEKDEMITSLSRTLDEYTRKLSQTDEDLARTQAARQIRGFLIWSVLLIVLALGATSAGLVFWKPRLGFWKTSSVVWSAVVLVWMWLTDWRGQTRPSVKGWRPYAKFHEARKYLFGLVVAVTAWTFYQFVGGVAYEWFKTSLAK